MESVFLTDPILLPLWIAALLCIVASLAIPRGILSAISSVAGALLVITCLIYGLLLGASLEEALVFVLLFTAVSILTFFPSDRSQGKNSRELRHTETDKRENEENKAEAEIADAAKEEEVGE